MPQSTHQSEIGRRGLKFRDSRSSLFWVYVLKTERGSYVGHTNNVPRRVEEHQTGRSASTRGSHPTLQWQSQPIKTRRQADSLERVLKSLRDINHSDFEKLTGHTPVRFTAPPTKQSVRLGERYVLPGLLEPGQTEEEYWAEVDAQRMQYELDRAERQKRVSLVSRLVGLVFVASVVVIVLIQIFGD